MRIVYLSPFLLLLLTACGTERVVERPVVHEVVRVEWREIPADLTARCPKSEIPDELTFGQAVELWAEDRASIDGCNGKLAGIDSLGQDDGGE